MLVEASISINGSRAAIWAATTNIEHFTQLLSGVEKIEVVEKPATGLIGQRWRETRILFGKPATVEKWITEAVENEFYKTRAEDSGFVFVTTNRISGRDGSVTLTGIHETQPQGFAARLKSLPMVFFKGVIKKAILQDLNDIKAAIEPHQKIVRTGVWYYDGMAPTPINIVEQNYDLIYESFKADLEEGIQWPDGVPMTPDLNSQGLAYSLLFDPEPNEKPWPVDGRCYMTVDEAASAVVERFGSRCEWE